MRGDAQPEEKSCTQFRLQHSLASSMSGDMLLN